MPVTALALDVYNNVYIAGEGFVIKYSQITSINELLNNAEEIEIYPNPVTNNVINFSRYLHHISFSVFDSFGKEILVNKNFSGKSALLPQKLQSGLYFIEIYNGKLYFIKNCHNLNCIL
ncbi:MAG: T9SS type A sorting domain-containing protein [Bacteroidetes bacterium]|nr:T9SS type A sorting domain-containing protein [Bacteroidota bacterium]